MSVSNQETVFQYVGNGTTVTFPYNCQVQQANDLDVYLNDAPITSGITKNGIGNLSGGSVTFSVAPIAGAAVRLERVVELERTTDYQQNGDFLARVVNPDFDRIWMALQQFFAGLSRSLRFPKSDVNPNTELPPAADRANKLLGFDPAGNPTAYIPASGSAADVLITLATSAGASLIGFIQDGIGAVMRTVKSKLQDHLDAKDFGAVCDGVTDDTDAIARLIAHCKLKNKRAELTGDIAAKWIVLQDLTYNFTLHGNNVLLYAIGTDVTDGLIQVINCVDFRITGTWHIYGTDNTHYQSIVRVKAISGTAQACTRISIENITVRRAAFTAFWIGTSDLDFQCSEITLTNCHAFQCTAFLHGAGSQSGATFVGCSMVSEYNPAFGILPLRTCFFEGGFWYIVGGEIVQPSAAPGDVAIECRPAESALYGNPYPIVKVSNCHIENSGLLLYLNNIDGHGPTQSSYLSSFGFSNSGGFMGSSGLTAIESASVPDYSGKIVFDNTCAFYGNDGVMRVRPHIVLGANTVIDLDGTPFGQSFYPGLSGLFTGFYGKPRLRGETILARQGAITVIADATYTTVAFPDTIVTTDTAYGDSMYAGGLWTATQDMKDVIVDYQLAFASSCPSSDSRIAVDGVLLGSIGTTTAGIVKNGHVVIPFLAKGSYISIQARTASGGPIALTGSSANFIRISASTQ